KRRRRSRRRTAPRWSRRKKANLGPAQAAAARLEEDGNFDSNYYKGTEESDQFRIEVGRREKIQDEGLDSIGKGLETLKNMASDMNEELDREVPLMDEIEVKVDRANADIKNTNFRLKETVLQLMSTRNFLISSCSASFLELLPTFTNLEWKLIYVGSAEDENYDQLLENVLVGPVNVGTYRFVLQADPPDPSKIREEDIIGVTVLLLTCSYMGQEFIRVGYYVNNDYDDEQLREEPPMKLLIDRVQRNILADKP
ncbi:hypothetical protein E2562_014595, partial [Oryza meyeriana var. granulata]